MERKYEFIANASKDFMTLINKNYIYEAVNLSFRILMVDKIKFVKTNV